MTLAYFILTSILFLSSRKIDCPVRLRISSTPDGQRLVIRESLLDGHNHEVSEVINECSATQGKRNT